MNDEERTGPRPYDPTPPKKKNEYQKKGYQKPVSERRATRTCLRCDKEFDSEGPWNRLCGKCQIHASQTYEKRALGGTPRKGQSRGRS